MEKLAFESYVIDVLMPDLVGHDRRPAAFVVYLFLLRQSGHRRRATISVSLQSIATKTGLSKSSVQGAIPTVKATVTNPVRRVLRPWIAGQQG